MKVIRCNIPPFQVDDVLDALTPFDLAALTVTASAERFQDASARKQYFRGCPYTPRLRAVVILEATADDDMVDDVVRVLMDRCSSGPRAGERQILILRVDEWYTVRVPARRTA